MTFDPAIPLNAASPGLFPAQNRQNMARLQTLLGADHQFNLTAASNDGYHNLIHKTVQAPSGALASTGRSYVKVSAGRVNDFYMDDNGVEYQVTPTMPIRAAVAFDGTGAIQGTAYNVASVTLASTSQFTINFTRPMPDANYVIQVTGMRPGSGDICNGSILGGTFSSSVNTARVKVIFTGGSSSEQTILRGYVTIFSVT